VRILLSLSRPRIGTSSAAGYLGLILVLALLGGAVRLQQAGATVQARLEEPVSAPAHKSYWTGVGSCAAAACHACGGAPGSAGSEYTTWIRQDPHARAYSVLSEDRSARMVRNLREPQFRPATEHPLCLGCHVRNDAEPAQISVGERLDGVGCENCHGPAGNWVSRHYLAEWKTPDKKRELGMRDTRDLRLRAEACAACHVGSPGRDVNHDLIAAGHPRLSFEFAAYLDVMPKHWDVRAEKQRIRDFEIRAWTIGQLVSARAALALLADRADERNARRWPEFAEYDCYACHHGLRANNWQARNDYAGRSAGSLPWGTWYFSLLPQALAAAPGAESRKVAESIKQLRRLMQQRDVRAKDVALKAQNLIGEVETLTRRLTGDKLSFPSLAVLVQDVRVADLDWDRATQTYCALAAQYQGRQDADPAKRDADLEKRLQELASLLRFPEASGRKPHPNSPSTYDREQFLKRLQDLSSQPGK